MSGFDRDRFAIALVVKDVLSGVVVQRPHHCPRNEVGEGDFSTASAPQVVVDDNAVIDHQFRGNRANTGCRRNLDGLVHIGREGLCDPAQGGHFFGSFCGNLSD